MKRKSLQQRLAEYLKKRPNHKIAKGTLADLARQKMGVTGETVGRRLRILHEASSMTKTLAQMTSSEHARAHELLAGGRIEVEHRDKNHCFYWYEPPKSKLTRKIVPTGPNSVTEEWVKEPL